MDAQKDCGLRTMQDNGKVSPLPLSKVLGFKLKIRGAKILISAHEGSAERLD